MFRQAPLLHIPSLRPALAQDDLQFKLPLLAQGLVRNAREKGEYILRKYQGRYYAKCQNLSRVLRGAYDSALTKYDLLLMPTLPIRATPIPGPTASEGEIVQRALEMLPNTSPFDVTGHPAMSIPCGLSDGRPVGLMLIGKHHNESTIYGAAYAFEQSGDWMKTAA